MPSISRRRPPSSVLEAAEAVAAVVYDDVDAESVTLENSGYVVTTLQAGLYHGLTAATPMDAIVDAVMMGGDTDTIGAVAGAVAGAQFGIGALPERWTEAIAESEELRQLGATLAEDCFTVAPAAEVLCADGSLDL